LLATNLPLLPRRLQLPIPLGLDLLLMPGEHVLRRDTAGGSLQADVGVMLDETLHQTPRIFQRQRRARPNVLSFERFVPTFDSSVRLRVERRSSDVRHARDPKELFEVLCDELRSVVGDDPWPRFRVLLLGSLHDDIDVGLRDPLA
jgi:hypothetical protein